MFRLAHQHIRHPFRRRRLAGPAGCYWLSVAGLWQSASLKHLWLGADTGAASGRLQNTQGRDGDENEQTLQSSSCSSRPLRPHPARTPPAVQPTFKLPAVPRRRVSETRASSATVASHCCSAGVERTGMAVRSQQKKKAWARLFLSSTARSRHERRTGGPWRQRRQALAARDGGEG